ncbi:MAG: hypothetical protein GF311_11720 [Candidatus Lokiarchaeota archaeon]|nr:hypothetical protein [Candidatus Lokiarchaeota archaeon]
MLLTIQWGRKIYNKSNLKSKFLGGIVGSALGDAIGEIAFRYNNKTALSQQLKTQKILRYTDDTAMAIGIAETIISNPESWTTQDLGTIFHQNYRKEPYRGYGMGPPTIFRRVENSKEKYQSVAQNLYRGEGSFGNGASMRIAPLGIFYYDIENIYQLAERSSLATHTHPLGIDGAAILAKLLGFLVKKNPQNDDITGKIGKILEMLVNYAKTREYREKLKQVERLLSEDVQITEAEYELGSNVLAHKSVPFSIYAFFRNPNSYKKALLETVLISQDRDTVGAMVGGLLGSYVGINQIPDVWTEKLENKDYVTKLANKLYNLKN